ncbi:unnamed protein product [Cochlearia groenlandica]
MLNEEAPGGAAAQDVYNLFQATEEGKKSPFDFERKFDLHLKTSLNRRSSILLQDPSQLAKDIATTTTFVPIHLHCYLFSR